MHSGRPALWMDGDVFHRFSFLFDFVGGGS